MSGLPIHIVNEILQMVAELEDTVWYYHVLENGMVTYKYNMKSKPIQKIEYLYSIKKQHPVSLQKLILHHENKTQDTDSFHILYSGTSNVIGEFEDKIYVYKSFESQNGSKETIYLFLMYTIDHFCYYGNYKNLERGILYKQGKEYNIITYTLLNSLKIKEVYHYNVGICFYD